TCWWLGGLAEFESLGLRRWAHRLGYGGHFSTKSRRYSTTLTALRQARADHRAEQQRASLGLADYPTVTIGEWRYAGRGYSPEAALLAASVREGGGLHGT
ncbi:replication initiator, partial [Streptomyces cellulosae]